MKNLIITVLIFTFFSHLAQCQESYSQEEKLKSVEKADLETSRSIDLLINAIKKNDSVAVKCLVLKNPNLIYETNSEGLSPIVASIDAEAGWEIYQFLLEKGKEYKAAIYPLKYPFHNAIATSNKIQITMLLLKSSDSSFVNTFDCFGDTPVDIALKIKESNVKSVILKKLKDSGGLSSKEIRLAKAEAELKAKQAAALSNEKQLQEIKAAKSKEEAELAANYPVKYPLHQAILDYNKLKIFALLSKKDVSINEFDCYGQTPCDITKKISNPGRGLEIFNLLRTHGGATSEEVKAFANDTSTDPKASFWEYKTVFYSDLELIGTSFEERMNKLGQEGWEMISHRRAKSSFPIEEWGVEASLKRKAIKKN